MKNLLKSLLMLSCIIALYLSNAKAACTASFTKSVNGLTVTFSNTSTTSSGFPSMMMYYWSFGDGTYSVLKNPVKTYSSGGIKVVQLMINDSFGCTTTINDTIVLSSTTSSCSASFTKTVNGLTANFNNTSMSTNGSSSTLAYFWTFGDGTSSTLKNPSKTYTIGGAKIVKLSISDSAQGCFSSKTDTLLLTVTPTLCASNFTKTINGLTVMYINSSLNSIGTSAGLTYQWTFYDGPVVSSAFTKSTSKDYFKIYTTGGTKLVNLTITDTMNNCSKTISDTVVVVGPTSLCAATFTKTMSGLTVNFNNSSVSTNGSGSTLSYLWTFGDGTSSTLKNPSKTYASGGAKIVKLNISDSAQSCFSSKTDTLFLIAPVSLCAANYTKTVNGLNVTFNNTSLSTNGSSSTLSYLWTFGDGTSSTLKNPSKTYTTAGIKIVKLSISDSAQSCFSSKTDTLLLTSSVNQCAASFTKTISGLTATFNNTSLNTNGTTLGLSYLWEFIGPNNYRYNSTLKNPVITFPGAGRFQVLLSIRDSLQSCSSFIGDTAVISGTTNLCKADFSQTISGLTVTLTNNSLNSNGTTVGLSYFWDFGDSTTSTLKNPIKTYSVGGYNKSITLYISDSARGCYSFSYVNINLIPAPLCQASFSLGKDTVTPFNFYILNTSIVNPTTSYFWSFGDGTSSTLSTPSHYYSNFGKYLICLTISDSVCTSTFCDSVGMDSRGMLLKKGGFGFKVLNFTTLSKPTGAKELKMLSDDMVIFPNPAGSITNIKWLGKQNEEINIRLLDLSGKEILSKTLYSKNGENIETIDLSNLANSIYFIHWMTEGNNQVYKLIKN